MVRAYCVKCKKKVEIKDPKEGIIKPRRGSRNVMRGTCPICGTKVSRIIGS